MKIVLLGYMASGKSTIGKVLASEINIPFIDLDHYIEGKENKTVSEIFKEDGEIYFRLQEHTHLKELLDNKEDFVLSLGGGTPCYANNMELIKKYENTLSFYLKASIKTLLNRLETQKDQRPLVANLSNDELKEYISKHLFERSYYYEQAAHNININDIEITRIVSKIQTYLG